VLSRVARAIEFILLIDVLQSYIHLNPIFNQGRSITSQGPLMLFPNMLIVWATPWAVLNLQLALFSGLTVIIGLYTPEHWPKMFRRWLERFTVRRCAFNITLKFLLTSKTVSVLSRKSNGKSPEIRRKSYSFSVHSSISRILHQCAASPRRGLYSRTKMAMGVVFVLDCSSLWNQP
jgi:hypothetical protein